MNDNQPINLSRTSQFSAGRIVTTTGAKSACNLAYMMQCLHRHMMGDWGVVDAEDQKTNDRAVKCGSRIISAYPIDSSKPCKGFGDNTLWIITEADRSVTTFLLPSEY